MESLTSIVLFAALVGTLASVASLFIAARRTGVVPMPSSRNLRGLIVEILASQEGFSVVTDLGSGWGGLARRIARAFPKCSVVAAEHSQLPLLVSRIASGPAIVPNLRHVRTDIYDIQLRDNEAYVCYLSGSGMKRLRRCFERDLPRNGILVSAAFAMPGWTATEVRTAHDLFRSPVYVYRF